MELEHSIVEMIQYFMQGLVVVPPPVCDFSRAPYVFLVLTLVDEP